MTKFVDDLEQRWRSRLRQDNPRQSQAERDSILCWLLGEDRERWENLKANHLAILEQGIEYRYRLLQQRYLDVNPAQAYRNLIARLGSLAILRNKISTWVALSRDRQRAVADVLQEVIQEMLKGDRYIQEQMAWIAQCTTDERLRNRLLFATLEEYALRPIRNQPLLLYRFVNFLRRQSRSGLTQVPQDEMVRLISEEFTPKEGESPLHLLDERAIAAYQESQSWEEQQTVRRQVQQEFSDYLGEKVGPEAAQWLTLYLQGRSQESIAQELSLPIKQIYRLREKVNYHAVQVFALRVRPQLVANWLEISLTEHNFGLTPSQWQSYWQQLTPIQQEILSQVKAGQTLEAIAQALNWKKSQVTTEWSKLYLAAQALRVGNSP
jgi:DNA-binding NarL/FixJ family response regulator